MGKRIAFVGTGALGGYVGGYLAHHGQDVTLIDMWPEHIEAIRARGLELDGVTPEEKFAVTKAKTMHFTEVQMLAKQKPIDIAFVVRQIVRHRVGDDADQALSRDRRLRRFAAELPQRRKDRRHRRMGQDARRRGFAHFGRPVRAAGASAAR